jgi:DNA polymerase III subunit epsilon
MRWWFSRKPREGFVENYFAATPKRVAEKTPFSDLRFAVLDAETTGFDASKDRMLSLAVVEVKGGRIGLASLSACMIYHDAVPVTPAVSVHGILPADTARGRREEEVLQELLQKLPGAIIVGHHVGFDVAMINAALKRHHGISLRNPLLDTAMFAMKTIDAFGKTGYPGQSAPTLDEVCAQCGITPVERHTAEGDAFTTAILFLTLCTRLTRKLGRPPRAGDLPLTRA